jgi:hypothetical protein
MTSRLRLGDAFELALARQVRFELGEHAEHIEEALARGRALDFCRSFTLTYFGRQRRYPCGAPDLLWRVAALADEHHLAGTRSHEKQTRRPS